MNDTSYDNDMDMGEEERQYGPYPSYILLILFCRLQMLRAEKDDQMFPDEVDTPLDMLAKTRFARLEHVL